jgi:hypothetical protein
MELELIRYPVGSCCQGWALGCCVRAVRAIPSSVHAAAAVSREHHAPPRGFVLVLWSGL